MSVRVGSRRSRLARVQTEQVLASLCALGPPFVWESVLVETTGDVIRDVPLREAGGKGLFVKELDDALLEGRVDCAVHSLKDIPTELPAGIRIACVPLRADARDVLLSRDGVGLDALAPGAVVGTTSLRRGSQLLAIEPRLRVKVLRGNVETRLRRLIEGEFDMTLLAAAGLARLGVDPAPAAAVPLDPFSFVPAPGQGALAITVRVDDEVTAARFSAIDDPISRRCVEAERATARVLGGSCHLPVAVHAVEDGGALRVVGLVASPDGSRVIRDEIGGLADDAVRLGERLGGRLLEAGGGEIVEAVEADAAGSRETT